MYSVQTSGLYWRDRFIKTCCPTSGTRRQARHVLSPVQCSPPCAGKYLTPHPRTNIQFYYAPWVVADTPSPAYDDLSPVTLKTTVTVMYRYRL